jgi:hypothetical protein
MAKNRARISLPVALVIALVGFGGAAVRANYYSDNTWDDSYSYGGVSIWVDWNLEDAVAAAWMWVDDDGDAQVEMWVHGGSEGPDMNRDEARDTAEDEQEESGEWCGYVTAKANFWYIEGSNWDDWGQHVPAEVFTLACMGP